jgi:hypothetical protein
MEFLALSRFMRIRLGIALVGVVIWFSGVRVDDSTTRLVGMAVLGVALLLRLLPKRFQRESTERETSD